MKRSCLTDCEVAIMRVLWNQGPATATELLDGLKGRWSNSALRTFLRILEEKGHVRHSKRSRSFVYEPLTTYDQALQTAVDALARDFFDDSQEALRRWFDQGHSSTPMKRPRKHPKTPLPRVEPPTQPSRFEETWLL